LQRKTSFIVIIYLNGKTHTLFAKAIDTHYIILVRASICWRHLPRTWAS